MTDNDKPSSLRLVISNADPQPSRLSRVPDLTLAWQKKELPKPPVSYRSREDYNRQVYHQLGPQSRALLDLKAKREAERKANRPLKLASYTMLPIRHKNAEAPKMSLVVDVAEPAVKKTESKYPGMFSPRPQDHYPH